jgi:alpha-tubulin suppressor-like RCC1 family protein
LKAAGWKVQSQKDANVAADWRTDATTSEVVIMRAKNILLGAICAFLLSTSSAGAAIRHHHPRVSQKALVSNSAVAWGENSHGQLGDGKTGKRSDVPVAVKYLTGITQVAAGYHFSLVLAAGKVYAFGGNVYGQLGLGVSRKSKVSVPTLIRGLSGVTAVAASGGTPDGMALLSDGTVRVWGTNFNGQLGNGHSGFGTFSAVPIPVKGISNAISIAVGGGNSYALLSNGTVMGWGRRRSDIPTVVKGLSGVTAISANGIYPGVELFALLSNGSVRSLGESDYGQAGGNGLANVAAISAGGRFALALLKDGTVMAWGADDAGQLGFKATETCGKRLTPCSRIPKAVLTGVSAVAAGTEFSLAVKGGRVDTWGSNDFGQLGNGTTTSSYVPAPIKGLSGVVGIAADEHHALARLLIAAAKQRKPRHDLRPHPKRRPPPKRRRKPPRSNPRSRSPARRRAP